MPPDVAHAQLSEQEPKIDYFQDADERPARGGCYL
jgi:hypothetical protein